MSSLYSYCAPQVSSRVNGSARDDSECANCGRKNAKHGPEHRWSTLEKCAAERDVIWSARSKSYRTQKRSAKDSKLVLIPGKDYEL